MCDALFLQTVKKLMHGIERVNVDVLLLTSAGRGGESMFSRSLFREQIFLTKITIKNYQKKTKNRSHCMILGFQKAE